MKVTTSQELWLEDPISGRMRMSGDDTPKAGHLEGTDQKSSIDKNWLDNHKNRYTMRGHLRFLRGFGIFDRPVGGSIMEKALFYGVGDVKTESFPLFK